MKGITLTASQAALEFGEQAPQIQSKLERAGEPIGRGRRYRLRILLEVLRPVDGGLKSEKIRETRLRADHLELQMAAMSEDLIPVEKAKALLTDALLPIRQRLLSLPEAMAARCNPVDPVFARTALDEWMQDSFRMFYEDAKGEQGAAPTEVREGEVAPRSSGEPPGEKPPAKPRRKAPVKRADSRAEATADPVKRGRVGKGQYRDPEHAKPSARTLPHKRAGVRRRSS